MFKERMIKKKKYLYCWWGICQCHTKNGNVLPALCYALGARGVAHPHINEKPIFVSYRKAVIGWALFVT